MTLCYLNDLSGLVFISPRWELRTPKRRLLVNGFGVVLPPCFELQLSLSAAEPGSHCHKQGCKLLYVVLSACGSDFSRDYFVWER